MIKRIYINGSILLLSVVLLTACATNQNSSLHASVNDESLADYRQVVLIVHGLSCPLCATNAERTLSALTGVTDVHVDLEEGRITVDMMRGNLVTRQRLVAAVTEAGFTLREIIPIEE